MAGLDGDCLCAVVGWGRESGDVNVNVKRRVRYGLYALYEDDSAYAEPAAPVTHTYTCNSRPV